MRLNFKDQPAFTIELGSYIKADVKRIDDYFNNYTPENRFQLIGEFTRMMSSLGSETYVPKGKTHKSLVQPFHFPSTKDMSDEQLHQAKSAFAKKFEIAKETTATRIMNDEHEDKSIYIPASATPSVVDPDDWASTSSSLTTASSTKSEATHHDFSCQVNFIDFVTGEQPQPIQPGDIVYGPQPFNPHQYTSDGFYMPDYSDELFYSDDPVIIDYLKQQGIDIAPVHSKGFYRDTWVLYRKLTPFEVADWYSGTASFWHALKHFGILTFNEFLIRSGAAYLAKASTLVSGINSKVLNGIASAAMSRCHDNIDRNLISNIIESEIRNISGSVMAGKSDEASTRLTGQPGLLDNFSALNMNGIVADVERIILTKDLICPTNRSMDLDFRSRPLPLTTGVAQYHSLRMRTLNLNTKAANPIFSWAQQNPRKCILMSTLLVSAYLNTHPDTSRALITFALRLAKGCFSGTYMILELTGISLRSRQLIELLSTQCATIVRPQCHTMNW